MTAELARLVSSDSRAPLQRLRRAQLWRIADRAGISYPNGAPAQAMVKILEAQGLTGMEAEYNDITRFKAFVQQDENGGTHVEHYPVQPKHHTADKVIDYDTLIEERAKTAPPAEAADDSDEIEELRRANHELAAKNAELEAVITERLDALEKKAAEVPEDAGFPLEKMLPWQLIHMAKDRGIDYKGLSKEDLIAAIRG